VTDKSIILSRDIAGKPVHRRVFTKADERDIMLYGYQPHTLPSLPEGNGDVAKCGELRRHPLRQEWNIYAPHRQKRTFKPSESDDPLAPSKPDGPTTEIPFTDFELAVFRRVLFRSPLFQHLSKALKVHKQKAAAMLSFMAQKRQATCTLSGRTSDAYCSRHGLTAMKPSMRRATSSSCRSKTEAMRSE